MKTFYTAQMLREEGARCPEVAIFKEEWPDGAERQASLSYAGTDPAQLRP